MQLDTLIRVLFGEWLYATHSVRYDALASVFLAFDLYDVPHKRFLCRERFWREMQGTGIQTVRALPTPVDVDVHGLCALVEHLDSAYGKGKAEGVYIRVDDDEWLVDRTKLVRSDFICGNTHWSRRPLEKNKFFAV